MLNFSPFFLRARDLSSTDDISTRSGQRANEHIRIVLDKFDLFLWTVMKLHKSVTIPSERWKLHEPGGWGGGPWGNGPVGPGFSFLNGVFTGAVGECRVNVPTTVNHKHMFVLTSDLCRDLLRNEKDTNQSTRVRRRMNGNGRTRCIFWCLRGAAVHQVRRGSQPVVRRTAHHSLTIVRGPSALSSEKVYVVCLSIGGAVRGEGG
jgi:hypothetical protein